MYEYHRLKVRLQSNLDVGNPWVVGGADLKSFFILRKKFSTDATLWAPLCYPLDLLTLVYQSRDQCVSRLAFFIRAYSHFKIHVSPEIFKSLFCVLWRFLAFAGSVIDLDRYGRLINA